MKISWGSKLAFIYIGFVVFVVAVALYAFRQDLNLVTDNYYEKELTYQTQIDKEKRADALPEKPSITFNNKILGVIFPKSYQFKEILGKIHLYRPANDKKDIILPLQVDSTCTQYIGLTSVEKGLWKIKLDWSYKKEEYFNELTIMVE